MIIYFHSKSTVTVTTHNIYQSSQDWYITMIWEIYMPRFAWRKGWHGHLEYTTMIHYATKTDKTHNCQVTNTYVLYTLTRHAVPTWVNLYIYICVCVYVTSLFIYVNRDIFYLRYPSLPHIPYIHEGGGWWEIDKVSRHVFPIGLIIFS